MIENETPKPDPVPCHPLAAQELSLFLQLNDLAQVQYVVQLKAAVKLHPRNPDES